MKYSAKKTGLKTGACHPSRDSIKMDLFRKQQSPEIIRSHVFQQQRKFKPGRFIGLFRPVLGRMISNNHQKRTKMEVLLWGLGQRRERFLMSRFGFSHGCFAQ